MKIYNFFVLSSNFCCIQKKWLQFTPYISDILRKSYFEMSQEKLKNVHYFETYSKFKETLEFCLFGNIFVNNWLKYSVLEILNAEFCHLPFYCIGKKCILRYFINYELLGDWLKTSVQRLLQGMNMMKRKYSLFYLHVTKTGWWSLIVLLKCY